MPDICRFHSGRRFKLCKAWLPFTMSSCYYTLPLTSGRNLGGALVSFSLAKFDGQLCYSIICGSNSGIWLKFLLPVSDLIGAPTAGAWQYGQEWGAHGDLGRGCKDKLAIQHGEAYNFPRLVLHVGLYCSLISDFLESARPD